MSVEGKLKHLEFIQAAIARMSNASFLFKGWSISLAGALFAFAVVNDRSALAGIAVVSTLLFWGLDAYYLWLEQRFRELYNEVAKKSDPDVDFSMSIDKDKAARRWLRTCFRIHLVVFYGTILSIEVLGVLVVRGGVDGT